ncbi:MAG: CHC2 zinc finger domain-containing protein [Candidatus Sumerlaeia bacterium]|nr:CHC2 zinc finger domain-containing protein [Candidatus Sumerlaeia bacterium]
MNETSYPAICAQVNSALEVRALVRFLGYFPEKIKREGDVYVALCPIHRDEVFRTLVLNPRNNTYHCRHLGCAGHHAADFLDLIVKVKGITLPEALEAVVTHFGQDYFRVNDPQMSAIRQLVAQVRPPAP